MKTRDTDKSIQPLEFTLRVPLTPDDKHAFIAGSIHEDFRAMGGKVLNDGFSGKPGDRGVCEFCRQEMDWLIVRIGSAD